MWPHRARWHLQCQIWEPPLPLPTAGGLESWVGPGIWGLSRKAEAQLQWEGRREQRTPRPTDRAPTLDGVPSVTFSLA